MVILNQNRCTAIHKKVHNRTETVKDHHAYCIYGQIRYPYMNMLLGIGNPLRGDDGAGNYIARHFRMKGWQVIDCGTAPENFTGVVRKTKPDVLVLVDAADMGLPPGEFRIIPPERIEDVGLGTHQLPLDQFISFIGECAGKVILVGIQPVVVEMGEGLSPAVQEGVNRLVATLGKGDIYRIQVLAGGL